MLPPGLWRFARHLPPVTGAFPAFALVLNLRVGVFAYILSPCWSLKQSLLKLRQFLPLPQPLLFFIARSYGDLSFWHWSPGPCGLAWGWDHLLPRCPSSFLSTSCECGTAHYAAIPASLHHTESQHFSTCLCVPAPPTCLDERVFFKSLVVILPYSSIFWQFWVLFVLKSSCNSFCGGVRRRRVFTYASMLTG